MDDSSTTSSFLPPSSVEANTVFTERMVISSRGYNVVVRAKRQGRWWALKGLQEQYRKLTAYQLLQRKEYDLMATLTHPHIAMVSSLENVEGLGLCIVMEWIDGKNLSSWLAEGTLHSRKERWCIAFQLLDALAYVHSRQIVHRDLKPSNIMLTARGNDIKLIDFGIGDADSYALFKQAAGTEGYVAPEQREGGAPDQRNDIYSVGCLLRDLHLGVCLRPVIRRCLKPIDRRYRNIDELRTSINRARRAPYYIFACIVIVSAIFAHFIGIFPQKTAEKETLAPVVEKKQTEVAMPTEPETKQNVVIAKPKKDAKEATVHSEPTVDEAKWINSNRVSVSPTDTTTLNKADCELINTAVIAFLPKLKSTMAKYEKDINTTANYDDFHTLKSRINSEIQPFINDYASQFADRGHNNLASSFIRTAIKQRLQLYIQTSYLTPLSQKVSQ